MLIEVAAPDWTARVLLSDDLSPHGIWSAECRTEAASAPIALAAAEKVLSLFAKGRTAFIRCAPEAMSEKDFDTKETKHRGFVRFSFMQEPGEWVHRDPNEKISLAYAGMADDREVAHG